MHAQSSSLFLCVVLLAAAVLIVGHGGAAAPLKQAARTAAARVFKVDQTATDKQSPTTQKSRAARTSAAPNMAPGAAARRAQRRYGGRVLSVALEDGPGGSYYRVKLLDDGRVRVVHVEARR